MWLVGFVGFMVGGVIGFGVMAVLAAGRDEDDVAEAYCAGRRDGESAIDAVRDRAIAAERAERVEHHRANTWMRVGEQYRKAQTSAQMENQHLRVMAGLDEGE